MKARPTVSSRAIWLFTLATLLISASKAFAQEEQLPPDHIASLSFFIILGLALYAYLALAMQTIARKTETENDWFAWIPIANLFLLLAVAKKPLWWFFLLLIPLANVVVIILIWMGVAEARGKPNWWGILMLVPIVSLIVPGYLAWSE
jgi:hypothetical protein